MSNELNACDSAVNHLARASRLNGLPIIELSAPTRRAPHNLEAEQALLGAILICNCPVIAATSASEQRVDAMSQAVQVLNL